MDKNIRSGRKIIVIGYLGGVIFIIAGIFFIYDDMISEGCGLVSSIHGDLPLMIAGVVVILVTNIAKKKSEIEEYKEKIRECEEKIKRYEEK